MIVFFCSPTFQSHIWSSLRLGKAQYLMCCGAFTKALAGIDLLTGKVHALVRDRHRSREFIEFLKVLDGAYRASTAIKLILDNHSAHISKETRGWLATRPAGRFEFTFTPTHGSWLNLIEGFFSKFARSVLRHIRVASKQELKERIMADEHAAHKMVSRKGRAAHKSFAPAMPETGQSPRPRDVRATSANPLESGAIVDGGTHTSCQLET
jgi:transposase